jgi:hypothetical protein
MNEIWQVKEVSTYPYKWKVYPTRIFAEKNDNRYYFIKKEYAERLARQLNQDSGDTD